MTFCKRSFSLLFSLLLLFPVFSLVAHAENVDIPPYQILQVNQLNYKSGSEIAIHNFGSFTFTPHNSVIERDFKVLSNTYNLGQLNGASHRTTFMYKFISENDTESPFESPLMLEPNTKYKVNMKNIYHSLFVDHLGYQHYVRKPVLETIGVIYDDLSEEEFEIDYELNNTPGQPFVDLSFTITVERPVQYIYVSFISHFNEVLPSTFWDLDPGFPEITSYFGEYGDGENINLFTLEIESEEVGLLKSLIEWVKGIKSKVDDTFASVTSGFTNVVNNITNVATKITELPQKLWEKISEGLKSLFVPTEEQMTEYKDKWDSLLSSRFGAIYQVGTLVTNFFGNIGETMEVDTITLPKVSLDKVGIPFSFGGYEVDVVPSGFNTLITVCKKIISIACTFLFINGLRKRYDEVMRGSTA